jgi:hypothetical protein
MEEHVIMAKETEQATGTYFLESADRETSQNGKRNRASEGHSLPGERRPRNKSEWKINRASEGCSLPGERRQRNMSEWQKK